MDRQILNEHRRRNRETRSRWNEYTDHRQIVTRLLLGLASPSHTALCLLGAGNCNDLNLVELTGGYKNVHLVDIDDEALSYASGQVSNASHSFTSHSFSGESSQLVVHPALDVSGVTADLEAWKGKADVNDKDFAHAMAQAKHAAPSVEGEPFDVVVSCCLLSQLIDSVVLTKTEGRPRFMDLLFAVRNRHLQLLWHWTKPGGVVVLVTDFVSSSTFPQLAVMTSAQLSAAFPQMIEQRNFFTGTNPVAVRDILQGLGTAGPADISGPWVWPVGARIFAVCAVVARKP